MTDGVDVEAAGPREIEVILAEGTTLSDGWIVFPTESGGKTGTRKICGCRAAELDLDLWCVVVANSPREHREP
ncbi:hypothetical protein [Nocardia sp. A7]|uniref:hypothetical protein n=1 Tax=Nocardia sp. A7 TaxID=2789274 RepID=UPI0039780F3A